MSASPDNPRRRFRDLLARPHLSIMPGGFSPLYARMDEAAGFESFFVAGSQTSAFMYGVPDMGLVGLRDIRELEEQFLPRRLKRDYVTTFGH